MPLMEKLRFQLLDREIRLSEDQCSEKYWASDLLGDEDLMVPPTE
jgi:hypothetical protein